LGDQYNNATGVADLQTQDPNILSIRRVSAFDMSVGAFYYDAMPGKKLNAFGGFSLSHLTKPKTSFTNNGNEIYPMRTTLHGGVRIAVNSTLNITPNFLYMSQGQATEKMLGATGQYKYNATTDLMAGINYRFQDAIAPFIGFTYNNYMFGACYDINTSDLGKSVPGTNGFEFTLSYIGRKSTKTPEVEFVCPRL
jgi:type IX secretion system PorP/SprF family membrane protein